MRRLTLKFRFVLVAVFLFSVSFCGQAFSGLRGHPATDVCKGWCLAVQAWTFNRFTFYEAVDKTASLGLDWIEGYPGQQLSKDKPEARFEHNMSAALREEVKTKLKEAGVRLVNYGVVGLETNEEQCREVFEFARDMGIETIVSEPPPEAMDLVEKLCEEYKIKVAIHNHPKPSRYWDPDKVLAVCKDKQWIGACADTGHWLRSGIKPLDALKKLEGQITSLHFKDLDDGHDVPWGTGKCDVKAMLRELDHQGFEGIFSIEYEYNWDNSVPDVRKCVSYFNKVASDIEPSGWKDLFDEDLSNAVYEPGSWEIKDSVLTANRDAFLWAKDKFDDFVLDLEFKVADGSNSGVFLRCGSIDDWLHNSMEVQVLDSYGRGADKHSCGAIYDCLAPAKNAVRKPGRWNHYTIVCKDNRLYVLLNSERIIKMDLNEWSEAHKNPDGTENKFNKAIKDLPRSGHIGLQGKHGDAPIWYRNIKIKEL